MDVATERENRLTIAMKSSISEYSIWTMTKKWITIWKKMIIHQLKCQDQDVSPLGKKLSKLSKTTLILIN